MEERKINCFKCRYFQTTWDQRAPYGCKLYQLKSQQLPSVVVKTQSGQECMGFETRPEPKRPLDLNSDDLW